MRYARELPFGRKLTTVVNCHLWWRYCNISIMQRFALQFTRGFATQFIEYIRKFTQALLAIHFLWVKRRRYEQDKASRARVPIVRKRATTQYCDVDTSFLIIKFHVAEPYPPLLSHKFGNHDIQKRGQNEHQ